MRSLVKYLGAFILGALISGASLAVAQSIDNWSPSSLPGTASVLYGYDGAAWDRLQVDSSGSLKVTTAGTGQGKTLAAITSATSTVAVTDTFQTLLSSSSTRVGCQFQNSTSGNGVMYIFFGANASATKATSIALSAGGLFNCDFAGAVYTGNIAITGTATNAYAILSY